MFRIKVRVRSYLTLAVTLVCLWFCVHRHGFLLKRETARNLLWTQRAIPGRFLELSGFLGIVLYLTRKELEKTLLLVKLTWSSFTSVPYLLVAWQV